MNNTSADSQAQTIRPDEYCGLHQHSDGSTLDGYSLVSDIVQKAKDLGQTAVTITDHGNFYNSYELYSKALAAGLKPVIGIEAYVAPSPISHTQHSSYFFSDNEEFRKDDVSSKGAYTHMLLFAKNNEGLKSLFKLSELSYSEGYYRKPRMSLELFEKYVKGNIIATTGCPSGELQTLLRLHYADPTKGYKDQAKAYLRRMIGIFGPENYYMELMNHNMSIDLERKVEEDLLALAEEFNIPLLATTDSHYTSPGDAPAHEHLLCISTHSKMSIPTSVEEGEGTKTRFAFDGEGYYIQSAEEMLARFPENKYPGAVRNSMRLANQCEVTIEPNDKLRPQIDLPEGETEASWLRKEVFAGLKRRLPDKVNDPEYLERIEKELGVIVPKNYSGYFLVVSDFLRWAKSEGIPCGPGRGSAAGSLLAYCIDITDADPIRFGLLFERFLNEERTSPPDIDIDLSDLDREKVIEYVKSKYGEDHVAQVVTFGKILAKNSIKDTVRILDLPYGLGDKLTKAMPEPVFGKTMSLADMYDPNSARYDEAAPFRELVVQEGAGEIVDIARSLEGRIRSTGVHAAAVIVSAEPIVDHVPVSMRQADGAYITQWDYPTVEHLGLLKFDFLGLRNLGIIQEAVANIKKRQGIELNPREVIEGPLDDPKVYRMLSEGNTIGVFQLDGGGLRSLLKLMKPTEFQDISAVLSLYRPGPMGVNAHTDYALRKNKQQAVDYIHPELTEVLTPILGPTFGLCVAGDTMIWDATTGERVRIDSIEEQVRAGNFYTWSTSSLGMLEPKKVTHWFLTGEKQIYTIKTETGKFVRVSGQHPVLTDHGYKMASELTVHDWVASPTVDLKDYPTGEATSNMFKDDLTGGLIWSQIETITVGDHEKVYDITVEDNHNFIGNDLVLHNCIYQEQVQLIAREMAGYSLAAADNLRRAMGKKKKSVLDAEFIPFQAGSGANGYSDEAIKAIWDVLVPFADYAFNKCFADDTLVRMADGSVQTGRELYNRSQAGDELWVQSVWADGVTRSHKVRKVVDTGLKSPFRLTTSTGRTIVTSEDHRLLTTSGYLQVKDMIPGVTLLASAENITTTRVSSRTSTESYMPQSIKAMATFLTKLSVPFEMRTPVEGGVSDFYFAGKHWEMDTLDRHVSYFEEKYGDEPFVVVTPESYKAQIIEHLGIIEPVQDGDLVVSIEKIPGTVPMIDIEMEDDGPKNFVTADGIVSHNSHTVAYGLTSYMTAYLKANYGTEYMSALLSSVADDTDKTAMYLEDCRQNGIRVLPPDVSRSDVMYSPLSDTEISFGLKAIRGIGEGAAQEIVNARFVNGVDTPFKDFNDLIKRLPASVVNKRILEGLAYGGALDSLGLSRRAVIHQLPQFLKEYQKKQRALKKNAGVPSLFDLGDLDEGYIMYPMDEYPRLEKLQLERHILGLYVSGHPIDGLNIANMASTTINNILTGVVKPIEGWPGARDIPSRIAGVVTSLAVRRSKKGDLFAIAKMEDRTGSIECAIFPKAYSKVGEFLKLDGVYQFVGFPNKRDGDLNFIVDSVRPLDFSASGNLSLRVKLTEGQWKAGEEALKTILSRHKPPLNEPGDDVVVSLKSTDGSVREVVMDIKVRRQPALLQEIQQMFGAISIGRWLESKKKPDAESEEA